MDATYILLVIAVVIPVVVFALTPYIAERVRKLEFRSRVSVECYRCFESNVSDCSAACSVPV
jgi:hypothetical protein